MLRTDCHELFLSLYLFASHPVLIVTHHQPPPRTELATFQETVNRHAGVPKAVEDVIHAMPHDAHPMAIILTGEESSHTETHNTQHTHSQAYTVSQPKLQAKACCSQVVNRWMVPFGHSS